MKKKNHNPKPTVAGEMLSADNYKWQKNNIKELSQTNGNPTENCIFSLLPLYLFRSVHPHTSFSKSREPLHAKVFAKIHRWKF